MTMEAAEQRQCVDTPHGRTSYIECGAGEALVLVHGVGLNTAVWAPQLDAFQRDHRVVAYDTLGHGGSDNPRAASTLSDYVGQLEALLEKLAIERTVLLGHSMGALVATRFAIEHPQRVAGLVAASPVYRRPGSQLQASLARLRELEQFGPQANLDDTLARWFGTPADPAMAGRAAQVRAWVAQADPVGYARAYRVFSEADPWLDGRLGELQAPALFITGALDPNSTPAMARAMAGEAPLGRYGILEGERHMVAYNSPERFNQQVRAFLADPGSGARPATPSSGTGAGPV